MRRLITDLLKSGKLFADIGLPKFEPENDHVIWCGSSSMLAETYAILDEQGFEESRKNGVQGDYVVERVLLRVDIVGI